MARGVGPDTISLVALERYGILILRVAIIQKMLNDVEESLRMTQRKLPTNHRNGHRLVIALNQAVLKTQQLHHLHRAAAHNRAVVTAGTHRAHRVQMV